LLLKVPLNDRTFNVQIEWLAGLRQPFDVICYGRVLALKCLAEGTMKIQRDDAPGIWSGEADGAEFRNPPFEPVDVRKNPGAIGPKFFCQIFKLALR